MIQWVCFVFITYFAFINVNYLICMHVHKGSGGDSNTGKTVAIVLGGVAALALGFIFLSFLRSCGDKDSIW